MLTRHFRYTVTSGWVKTLGYSFIDTCHCLYCHTWRLLTSMQGWLLNVLASVVRVMSLRCFLERPASKLFQPRASLSTRPSAIYFKVQGLRLLTCARLIFIACATLHKM